jgi:hypothetical protein
VVFATGAEAQTGNLVHVGANHRVTGDMADKQFGEVWLGSNPLNNEQLAACGIAAPVNSSEYYYKTFLYRSENGGESWQRAFGAPGDAAATDPTCEFDVDGTLYFATLRFDHEVEPYNGHTEIYHSRDGAPVQLQQILRIDDRDYLVTDRWPKHDRQTALYVVGRGPIDSLSGEIFNTIAAYRKLAGEELFAEPIRLVAPTSKQETIARRGAILRDGNLGIPITLGPRDGNALMDEGIADSRSRTIEWLLVHTDRQTRAIETHRVAADVVDCATFLEEGANPSAAIDASSSPFSGRLYVAWATQRFGRCRILLSTSEDDGKSWTPAVTIDGPGEFYEQWKKDSSMPQVYVNNHGVVAIMWYEISFMAQEATRVTRLAASLDGGATFLPTVTVSSAPANLSGTKNGPVGVFDDRGATGADFGIETGILGRGGETSGLVADARGLFHLLWVDNRTGNSEMWTAAVEVGGEVHPGAPDLPGGGWKDVTRDVTVEYFDAYYDASSKKVGTQVRLSTTSDALKGKTLTLRVTRAVSAFGDVDLADGNSTAGSRLLTFALNESAEKGRYGSPARELTFKLRGEPRPNRASIDILTNNLLRIGTRVYVPEH